MSRSPSNPAGDVLQFTIGGCLFGAGVFLFMNQVMVSSGTFGGGLGRPWFRGAGAGMSGWGEGGWGGLSLFPSGTPGMGLLMLPLAIGVCLLFAGSWPRLARLLVWGSLAALFVGVLNSLRLSFMPATLWQLAMEVVLIGSGGGLMFRSLRAYADEVDPAAAKREPGKEREDALRRELEELRRRLDAIER